MRTRSLEINHLPPVENGWVTFASRARDGFDEYDRDGLVFSLMILLSEIAVGFGNGFPMASEEGPEFEIQNRVHGRLVLIFENLFGDLSWKSLESFCRSIQKPLADDDPCSIFLGESTVELRRLFKKLS